MIRPLAGRQGQEQHGDEQHETEHLGYVVRGSPSAAIDRADDPREHREARDEHARERGDRTVGEEIAVAVELIEHAARVKTVAGEEAAINTPPRHVGVREQRDDAH